MSGKAFPVNGFGNKTVQSPGKSQMNTGGRYEKSWRAKNGRIRLIEPDYTSTGLVNPVWYIPLQPNAVHDVHARRVEHIAEVEQSTTEMVASCRDPTHLL
jgi:hypothetical protein